MSIETALFDVAGTSKTRLGKRRADEIRVHSDNPQRKLWLSVLVLAVMDCINGRLPLIWFYTDECEFICDLLALDHNWVIKGVRKKVIS